MHARDRVGQAGRLARALRPVAQVERFLNVERRQRAAVRRRQPVQPVGPEQPAPAHPAAARGLIAAEVAEIRGAFQRDQAVHGGGYPPYPDFPQRQCGSAPV